MIRELLFYSRQGTEPSSMVSVREWATNYKRVWESQRQLAIPIVSASSMYVHTFLQSTRRGRLHGCRKAQHEY